MATFTSVIPPSAILKSKDELGKDEPARQTKEQYRKMKELEEARKAGTVPAMTDEEGRDINPHIPQYIAQAPWYLGAQGPTLSHQRTHPERQKTLAGINTVFERGVIEGAKAARFRKGACENCGATTHKKKDCFERPRRLGAKFTGEDIAPAEHLMPEGLEFGYDAKRDRWSGYDSSQHSQIIENYQKLDEARKLIRAEKLREGTLQDEEQEEEEADEDLGQDEDKYAEGADMPGVKIDDDSKTRITVRNLRIREDTAKYLYNLAEDSPYYDPKSRSMRDNPFKDKGKGHGEVPFVGENFVRFSGEVVDVNEAQLFAWEAHRRGIDVHALAEPTKLEALRKQHDVRKGGFKDEQKQKILEQYGGAEHLESIPKELLLAQTEAFVVYDRKGKVVKGEERSTIKSSYEEDILINNHTSVWGSFWNDGIWGYACCHSFVKNSYCTGEAGKQASNSTADLLRENAERLKQQQKNASKATTEATTNSSEKPSTSGESEEPRIEAEAFRWAKKETEGNVRAKHNAKAASESESSSDSGSSSDSSSGSSSDEERNASTDTSVEEKRAKIAEDIKKKQLKTEKKRNKRQKHRANLAERRREDRKRKHVEAAVIHSGGDSGSSSEEEKELNPNDELVVKKAKLLNKTDEMRKALIKVARDERRGAELMQMDDRNRPYNKGYEVKAPTEYELEAYKMRRLHPEDPMAQFMSSKR